MKTIGRAVRVAGKVAEVATYPVRLLVMRIKYRRSNGRFDDSVATYTDEYGRKR